MALSRGVSRESMWVLVKRNMNIDPAGKSTKNIVYRDVLESWGMFLQQLYISVGCSNCIYVLIVVCRHALLSIYVVPAGNMLGDYECITSRIIWMFSAATMHYDWINIWCTRVNIPIFNLDLWHVYHEIILIYILVRILLSVNKIIYIVKYF